MTSLCYDNDIEKTQKDFNLKNDHQMGYMTMKLTVLILNTMVIAAFLTGFGVVFDKIESASLSNPFTMRTAQLNKTK